jgi:hypothetical protein
LGSRIACSPKAAATVKKVCLAIGVLMVSGSSGIASEADDLLCSAPSAYGPMTEVSRDGTDLLSKFLHQGFRCPTDDGSSSDLRRLASSCQGRIVKWGSKIKYYVEGWDVPYKEMKRTFEHLSKASRIDVDKTFFSSRANVEILFRDKAMLERELEIGMNSGQQSLATISRFKTFVKGEDRGCAGFARRTEDGLMDGYVLYVATDRPENEQLSCLNDSLARLFGLNSSEFLAAGTETGVGLKPGVLDAVSTLYMPEIKPGMAASEIVETFCRSSS